MSDNNENKLIPTLRFPEFKNEGEWSQNVIGDFVEKHKGGAPLTPSDFLSYSDYEVIPKKAISEGIWLNLDTKNPTYCSESFYNDNAQSIVDSTYLITTLRDLVPSGPSIGYIVKYAGTKKYILAQGVYGIKIKESLVPEFLIHFSNTVYYRKLVNAVMVGSTQVHIRNGDFFKLPIKAPKLKEQQKIAACLSSLHEVFSAESQKLETLQHHKKGLLQNLLPQEGETVPKFRFREFEEIGDWQETTLTQVADYENGKAHEQDIADDGVYIVVNSKFISQDGEVKKFTNTAFCPATQGDVLMVLSDIPNGRAIAKCLLVEEDNRYTVNQRICRITPRNLNSKILYYLLNRNPYFLAFDDGVKQTNLRKEDVLNCPLMIPADPKEQEMIADTLSSADDLINAQNQKLEALQRHKKGLLQGLFPNINEVIE
jgi:type I restriction enzyme S subunit